MPPLDVIVIADNGLGSLSASNPMRLNLGEYPATIQVVRNAMGHGGSITAPIEGEGCASWSSALKLNGIYLYNALNKAGFSTELIDDYQRERQRFGALASRAPRAVVISTTFLIYRDQLFELVRDVKRQAPGATVVVGGAFVMYSWRLLQRGGRSPYDREEFAREALFFDATGDETDLYIISDVGDALLPEVLKRLWSGGPLDDLPNTARPAGEGYVFAPRVEDVQTWQETPIDWAQLPDAIFASGVVPMRTSVGCPYQCSFCNFNKNPHLTRLKPLDDLVAELKAVQARGARYVWFADDNFRLGKRDLVQVCERFIAEGLTLEWMTLLRAEVLRDVEPDLLRRAGCIEVQMGIESADPEILAAMNKRSDPDANEAIITRLLKAGINCSCYFVIGFPGETEASVAKTTAFLKRLEAVDGPGLLSWSLYPFVLAPGSPVFETAQRELYQLEGYAHAWSHHTMDAKQARRLLLSMFMALDKSGPIYRGDNLDFLRALPPHKAKAFVAGRHELEKRFIGKEADPAVVCEVFRGIVD